MPEFTPEIVLKKIKQGEKIERADLRGIELPKAALEGVSFRRCDLDGANLSGAKLARAILKSASFREAYLVGTDLRDANLESADLEGANLERAVLAGANLHRANLEGANLEGADLTRARVTHAQFVSGHLAGAKLTGAILTHADFSECDCGRAVFDKADLGGAIFTGANLEEATFLDADVRHANFARAKVERVNFTGVRIAGIVPTGTAITGLVAEWADASLGGDGSKRIELAEIVGRLSGKTVEVAPTATSASAARRYFGRGDVLRNATLQFEAGASVEIESLFEACSIKLGEGTELIVGKNGVLAGCRIQGAGNVTVNGKFFEDKAPGIVGVRQPVVTAGGSLVGAVEQPAEKTAFGFEPGCRLRMTVTDAKAMKGSVQS
ncbi:MAG TPA: pentapeptide repeat-containing protein [Polyangiaceae bacterium]|jgi:uncharacterized protein YjbI with pentapeptide repeats